VFLALAMCMQKQCTEPQFTNHPQCVEMREKQKASQEQMMNNRN
jgi:hypothetical protein